MWYFAINWALFKNIFQVPEVPKRVIPEEKVPIAVPKKDAPPAEGT